MVPKYFNAIWKPHRDIVTENIIVWSSCSGFVTQNFLASYLQIGQGSVLSLETDTSHQCSLDAHESYLPVNFPSWEKGSGHSLAQTMVEPWIKSKKTLVIERKFGLLSSVSNLLYFMFFKGPKKWEKLYILWFRQWQVNWTMSIW